MPGITQNVTVSGSSNQVFVAGGDIRYEVFYELPPASAEDRRHLLELLERVRRQWIVSVLEAAVKDAALLEVGMQAEPRMEVERPWTREQQAVGGRPEVRPPGTGIGEVFEDAGRTLLILGQPGAGKTIALLALAREWAGRAVRDPFAPVPVVFNLSSWSASRRSIHDWMVHELAQHYRTGEEVARRWLKERRLLLLFDGLDEVVEERRAACVEAIDAFVHGCGIPGLAVCCRRDEYLELPVRLNVGGAVTLLPLTGEQIDAYVAAAGDGLSGVRSALPENAGLRALAESPLMLNVITAAFAGVPAHELKFEDARTRHALRDTIFARYVERMYGRRKRVDSGFSREQTEGWLRWVANGMVKRGETIFAVELLQPVPLDCRQLLFYAFISRILGSIATAAAIGGLVCLATFLMVLITDTSPGGALQLPDASTIAAALLTYLVTVVMIGTVAGLFFAPFEHRRLRRSQAAHRRPFNWLQQNLLLGAYAVLSVLSAGLVGLVATWVFGDSRTLDAPPAWVAVVTVLVSVPSISIFFGSKPGRGSVNSDINLAGTLEWHSKKAIEVTIAALFVGIILFGVAALFGISRTLVAVLLTFSTLMSVAYGSWRHDVPPVERWVDGVGTASLRNSGKVFACVSLGWIIVTFTLMRAMLRAEFSSTTALVLAVLTASLFVSPALMWFGGLDYVLHAALRLVLWRTGAAPLRLSRFLDYGVHLGFLRRAGGGYIFIHRLLLEHFAARAGSGGSLPG